LRASKISINRTFRQIADDVRGRARSIPRSVSPVFRNVTGEEQVDSFRKL